MYDKNFLKIIFSFSSPACKRTDFIAGFINNTLVRMEKSHAIYQALLVADQVIDL